MPRLLALLLVLTACTSYVPVPPSTLSPSGDHEPADDPDLAAEYQALKHAGTDDPYRSYAAARETMKRMPLYATNGDLLETAHDRRSVAANAADPDRPFGPWKFLGPGNIGGRTRALVIDAIDPKVMYTAGVSGGIWKTTSGGLDWTPVGDDLVNIAVNSLAISPADRNTLYAGTGEGYFRENERGTALPLRGNGIFVTHDGGETWTQLASTANEDFYWVNDLTISTHDPTRIYAATRTGVWRSVDAGTSWTRVLPVTVHGGCLDLAWRGDTNGDYVFASCGTFEQATVYRTKHGESDAADTWEAVLSESDMGRTTLAIAPSKPSVIYALSASNEADPKLRQGLLAVWRSDANGDAGSWTARITNKSAADVVGPRMLTNLTTIDGEVCGGAKENPLTMGWYTNVIAVDPADPERVWVGSVDLFRSDNGGSNWGVASYWWSAEGDVHPFVHADQHTIVFHPQYNGTTNKIAYFGNDGGLFKTTDARGEVVTGKPGVCATKISKMHFEDLNFNYGVTQFYHGAVFPDGRRFLAGAQDNGTIVGTIQDGPNHWIQRAGGDGGYVAVDPQNPELVYAESQGGAFIYSVDGGNTFRSMRTGLSDSFLFVTPFTIDPTVPSTIWMGGTMMWRNIRNATWQKASTAMPQLSMVSAVAVAPTNSNRVMAGTSKGFIVRTDSAMSASSTTQWAQVQPREGFVSSLAYDPFDQDLVYATYAGFGGTHVWSSVDGGATWSPLDGTDDATLPDIPAHSIAVDPTRPDRLYLGTDLGVFVSLDRGKHWAVENSGFASVVTEAVVIGQGANGPAVYAFTHGRGAWRAELVTFGPRRRGVR